MFRLTISAVITRYYINTEDKTDNHWRH